MSMPSRRRGLSGADLKRVVDDGKLLFAFEREKKGRTQPVTTYFLTAVETVRRNKRQCAEAEARARAQHPQRPAFFDPMSAFAAMAMNVEGSAGFQLGPRHLPIVPRGGLTASSRCAMLPSQHDGSERSCAAWPSRRHG